MGTTDKKYLDLQGLAYVLEKIDSKYKHPTTTAADPAAVKIGKDVKGHVVIGGAITASDVGAVPTSRKVNNKALTADITLGVGDISGAVPNTRTIAGIDLKDNITKDELRTQLGITGAMHFAGTTTTTLKDGDTTNPIKIKQSSTDTTGTNYTAISGDVVLYSGKEFIWTGSAWEILGDEGSYALKTRTINGDGTYITGGGTLEANRTLSHKTYIAADPAAVKVGLDSGGHVRIGDALTISESGAGKHSHTTTSSIAAEKVVTAVTPSTTKLSVTTGSESVVKSYPGSKSNLVTTSITGVTSSTTTASKATAGTAVVYGQADVGDQSTVATISDKTSKIGNANVGSSISITGVSGSTTASKATKGNAITVAKKAASATTVGNANVGTAVTVATGVKSATASASVTSDAYTASIDGECLVLSAATTTASVTPSVTLNTTSVTPATSSSTTIYGVGDTASITPYTFTDVTVPKAATTATTFNPATSASNTIETFLGETTVTSAKAADTTRKITPYTFADVTVPVKATSATTVATGSVSTTASGAGVLIGLGTATTATVLNSASLASGTTGTEVMTGVTATKGAVTGISGTTNEVGNHTHSVGIN